MQPPAAELTKMVLVVRLPLVSAVPTAIATDWLTKATAFSAAESMPPVPGTKAGAHAKAACMAAEDEAVRGWRSSCAPGRAEDSMPWSAPSQHS